MIKNFSALAVAKSASLSLKRSFPRYSTSSPFNRNEHALSSNNENINVPSHVLLQRLGYTRVAQSGIIHWLPLGLKVLRNIETIIHNRMTEVNGEEVSLSSLSPKELWEVTDRWNNTELFKLKDGKGAQFCLAPTCEEEITSLVRDLVPSYKEFPLLYYQISRKYRDEKRPRGGLLRGREFLMKDAYSFDLTPQDAMKSYDIMVGAYTKIFRDLGLPFVKAEADSGSIGGSLSHEWHYIHDAGEDVVFTCDDCNISSNVEKTISYPEEDYTGDDVEADVRYFLTISEDTLVALYFPAERQLVPQYIKEYIPDINLEFNNQDEILKKFSANEGDIITKKIVRVMDSRLNDRSILPDFPVAFHRGSFSTLTDIPLVSAKHGEICGHCNRGHIHESKAIEVGHTFYLGQKYSKPLDAQIAFKGTENLTLEMGCYGIGVSRLVGAIAEITKDEHGLKWPASIAPYHITFIEAPCDIHDENVDRISKLCTDLKKSYPELKIQRDLRDARFGRKIVDSKLIGIPLVAVVGKKFPLIEVEVRGKRFVDEKSSEFYKLYQEKKEQFDWSYHSATEKFGEKHFFHFDAFEDVIRALLKDL